MSPLAHLLFAAAALHAASAAAAPIIPAKSLAPAVPDSKLVPEIIPETPVQNNKPLDKEDAPALIVNEVENNLRAKPEDIPVQVVIEEVKPAIKTNEVSDDVAEEKERFHIDLKNPGPPQRQEHETQNSDQFSDAQQKLTAVQESITQTQNLLTQGIKGLGDDISNWLSTNEQVSEIEKQIQSLRESFMAQIQKLTEAVQNLAAPQPLKSEQNSEQAPIRHDLKEVEASLTNLKSKFDNGVRALSEGVNIVALLRADDASANPAVSQPASSPDGQNIMNNFISSFQNAMSGALHSFQSAASGLFNGPTSNPPSNVQADTPVGGSTSQSQGPITGFFNNIFNPNQNQGEAGQSPSPQGIIGQIQHFTSSIPGNFISALGWQTPAKPAEGSNVVPVNPTKAKPAAPSADAIVADPAAPAPTSAAAAPAPAAAVPAPAAAVPAPQAVGPIRQIVQRIQSSINNPEKPRDTEKPNDLQTKGGLYYGGHRPGGGSGDSDGLNSSRVKSQPEPIKEIKEEIKKQEDKEIIPKVVLEKTE